MSKKAILPSKELIYELYIEKNLSPDKIENLLHISHFIFSKCLKEYRITKSKHLITECRENTNLERYGVVNVSKTQVVKKRIGVANKLNSNTRVLKSKSTKLERYGDPNYNNMEKNRETKIINHSDPYYNGRDAYKKTMLAKYGVDNAFKLPEFKRENLKKLTIRKGYSETFSEILSDRVKSIEFLRDKNLGYYELSKEFNAPYYVIQTWVTRLNLQEYINYKFDGKSHYEDDIVKYLNSIGIYNIERNVKILDGEEADLFIPDNKLIIEFNGTYWHSDLFKQKNYHLNKTIVAEKLGYRLIHIYQYEWDDPNQQIKLKQLLRIACGKVTKKIYARNCEIKQIDNSAAKELNEAVHLQGHRNAKVTYGLFHNGKLVQLMSFSKRKKGTGDDWEIIRGCPGSNNIVIGGVSKLFYHFVKDYNPKSIFSYCDFNKFNGKSYEELGMKFVGSTGPDLTYIIKGQAFKRQYSNYKLIKGNVDYRIWGAGSKKYLWVRDSNILKN